MSENTYEDLKNMKIHDRLNLQKGVTEVLRVPNGWVYTTYIENGTGGYDMSSCFVPVRLS